MEERVMLCLWKCTSKLHCLNEKNVIYERLFLCKKRLVFFLLEASSRVSFVNFRLFILFVFRALKEMGLANRRKKPYLCPVRMAGVSRRRHSCFFLCE